MANSMSEDFCRITIDARKRHKKTRELLANEDEGTLKERPTTPNYFVAIKISNPEIHHLMDMVQQHILNQDIRLRKSMISLPTLHITLRVMHLATDEELSRAQEVLKKIHLKHNEDLSKNPLSLQFKGLGNFRNQVVFAKLFEEDGAFERLKSFASDVDKLFDEESLYSTDKKNKFTPHLTLMKLSKDPRLYRKGIKKIPTSLYVQYEDQLFGEQTVQGIQLLSMFGPQTEAGYYSGCEFLFDV